MKNFKFENIWKHGFSSFLGLLVILTAFFLVWKAKATFAEVSPILLVAVPFLLYGNDKNSNEPPKVM